MELLRQKQLPPRPRAGDVEQVDLLIDLGAELGLLLPPGAELARPLEVIEHQHGIELAPLGLVRGRDDDLGVGLLVAVEGAET